MLEQTKWIRRVIAPIAAGGLLLAACGGEDNANGAEPDPANGQDVDEDGDVGDDSDASDDQAGAEEALDGPVDVAFATLDQGSAWYSYGVSISQGMQGDFPQGSIVEVLPYSGSIGNPELVSTGEADIALTFSAVAAWAHTGADDTPFEDGGFDNLRVLVGGLDQYYFGPIAPANAPFDSLRQIGEEQMGISLVSQPRGSLGDAGTRLIMNAYGSSIEDIEGWGGQFEPTSTDVATNSIRDGQAELWIQAITAGHPNITELAQTADIQILEIDDDVIEQLSELGLSAATLPGGTFTGQDEDVQLLGFRTAIVTSAELDDDLAYAITKWVVENADQLKDANESMRPFEPSEAWMEENTGGVPLHPGAEQYFRDAGLMD